MSSQLPSISVVGLQNAGKTRLVQAMVRAFSASGRAVGVLKHDGHADTSGVTDWQKRGSDTELHACAGAVATAVVGGGASLWHVVADTAAETGNVDVLVHRLANLAEAAGRPLDMAIVEGYKGSALEKVVVLRTEAHADWFLASALENVVALVASHSVVAKVADCLIRVYDENDIEHLCNDLLARMSGP